MTESRLLAVVGGQYGSEGKGAIAAHLARQPHNGPTATIRVAGPNAGHTSIDNNGTPWPLRTIPATAAVNPTEQLLIAPGSEIDPTVLHHEIQWLEEGGHPITHRLAIDPQATILDPIYIQEETALTMHERIGSTGKGIGAARAARIMRTARTWGLDGQYAEDTTALANDILDRYGRIIIEGTQGYGLGLHAGHYPQCTSSDCRAIDFLAMAGLNPWQANIDNFRIYLATRPNPIRVAGNSGPLHGETTWENLGLPVELTTVTKKPRRVGSWDPDLIRAAVTANGGAPTVRLAVTMFDHAHPDLAGLTGQHKIEDLPPAARDHIWQIERDAGTTIELLGTGPATMVEVY
jgi:adenylosuccinate synthase